MIVNILQEALADDETTAAQIIAFSVPASVPDENANRMNVSLGPMAQSFADKGPDFTLRRVGYCASPVRLSDAVCVLRRDYQVPIETDTTPEGRKFYRLACDVQKVAA